MNKKFLFFLLFFLRSIVKKIESKLFFNEKKSLFYENFRNQRNKEYFFIKRNKDDDKKKELQNVYKFNNGISLINEKLKSAKENIFLFFKKDKNIIEKLKDLNEKKSTWFFTGYAKNIFNHNSFYNVIGLEEIKEIDYKNLILTLKIDVNKVFNKNNNLEKKNNFSIINGYEVKKLVLFYKNNDNSFGKDFILCTYKYIIFYVFDKENNKFYIFINNLGDENIIYEVKELNKKDFSDFFYLIDNKIDLNTINIISLSNKNIFKSHTNYMHKDESINGNYSDKFKFYLKKICAIFNNYDIFLKDDIYGKNIKSRNTLIYSKKNFVLKKKTYFQHLKNFFINNEEDNNLFEIIFRNNNAYKLYVQNDLNDNSCYILKSTKISKKKLDQLYRLFTNYDYKKKECKDKFFAYSKTLFSIYKNELEKEKEKRRKNENNNTKSIYISIGAKEYLIYKDSSFLKKKDEILLFSLAKQFLNNLISCINI
ncbi:conserved Plasmodium protein, unknown function [Plasmodium gallinaceum]|uniref:Uncharacterized protein n=1 Tax=Plasmodium gallinaceum TaxID=5849 RepID=A0A1J1GVN6_PLAGA|nr:conserved Plasmodium protein, unknown function [Plasmodium gallinaceum]CRG96608.1 conserved Plasmodium protein, unknown function [Plasmodium gallinaceum]